MTYRKYIALGLAVIALSLPLKAQAQQHIDAKIIFSDEAKAELSKPAKNKIPNIIMNEPFLFLQYYAPLLERHTHKITRNNITTTGVDYPAWKQDANHNLAINALKHSRLDELNTREKKLAFWINAFNLMAIDLIITNDETYSIQNLGGIVGDPWSEFSWDIGNKSYTLQYISEQILAEFMEPRAYFALSRASMGTPELHNKPFTPDGLYSQLNKQASRFINNKNHAILIKKSDKSRVNHKNRLYLSRVFEWHKNSIKGGDILRYLSRYYIIPENASYSGYAPFDWTLNSVATPPLAE